MLHSSSIPIRSIADVRHASAQTEHLAQTLGFGRYEAAGIGLATSEIATNAFRYAQNGHVSYGLSDNLKGVEIIVSDTGPGITNLELAMKDGYTTYKEKSLGLGLGAAKRAMDEMTITTSERGTTVNLKRFMNVPKDDLDYGATSFPALNQLINGDRYFIKEYRGENLLIAVIDGSGHGEHAAIASLMVMEIIEQDYLLELDQQVQHCHQALELDPHNYQAEIALIRITPDCIEYLILGNLNIYILAEGTSGCLVQNGRLGLNIPGDLTTYKFPRPSAFFLIAHSDGLNRVEYSAESRRPLTAQKHAQNIFNQFSILEDDATVVVVNG